MSDLPNARLIFDGVSPPVAYPLAARSVTIGRGAGNDVAVADARVSRAHARIYHRGRKFFLREEIGTSNGTFLNENRLQTGVPVELVDGDHVRFGLVKLVFRAGE